MCRVVRLSDEMITIACQRRPRLRRRVDKGPLVSFLQRRRRIGQALFLSFWEAPSRRLIRAGSSIPGRAFTRLLKGKTVTAVSKGHTQRRAVTCTRPHARRRGNTITGAKKAPLATETQKRLRELASRGLTPEERALTPGLPVSPSQRRISLIFAHLSQRAAGGGRETGWRPSANLQDGCPLLPSTRFFLLVIASRILSFCGLRVSIKKLYFGLFNMHILSPVS